MTHPQGLIYQHRRADPGWRLCWTCLNTGYRATVYRRTDDPDRPGIERHDPCSCQLGMLIHVRDGLKNLPGDGERRPVPLSGSTARLERIRAGMVAAGMVRLRSERPAIR